MINNRVCKYSLSGRTIASLSSLFFVLQLAGPACSRRAADRSSRSIVGEALPGELAREAGVTSYTIRIENDKTQIEVFHQEGRWGVVTLSGLNRIRDSSGNDQSADAKGQAIASDGATASFLRSRSRVQSAEDWRDNVIYAGDGRVFGVESLIQNGSITKVSFSSAPPMPNPLPNEILLSQSLDDRMIAFDNGTLEQSDAIMRWLEQHQLDTWRNSALNLIWIVNSDDSIAHAVESLLEGSGTSSRTSGLGVQRSGIHRSYVCQQFSGIIASAAVSGALGAKCAPGCLTAIGATLATGGIGAILIVVGCTACAVAIIAAVGAAVTAIACLISTYRATTTQQCLDRVPGWATASLDPGEHDCIFACDPTRCANYMRIQILQSGGLPLEPPGYCGDGNRCIRNECPPVQRCGSQCCQAGQACVSGVCQNPCPNPCGSLCCSAGETCVSGSACCPSSQICGRVCCASGQECHSGQCVNPCLGTWCGSSCCTASQRCVDGQVCAPQCPGGQFECHLTCCPTGMQCDYAQSLCYQTGGDWCLGLFSTCNPREFPTRCCTGLHCSDAINACIEGGGNT